MKQGKRLLSLLLSLLLLFGAFPAVTGAAGFGAQHMNAPQDYIRALSQLVADHWSDAYFSAMILTPGEAEFSIDGEVTAISTAPAMQGEEVLLPREAVAQLRELPREISLQAAQPLMTQHEAEAMGLRVQIENREIIVTAPYQTRRLLVRTINGLPGNSYGALVTLPLGDNRFALQYATEEQARMARLQLEADPAVLYAEPDGVLSLNAQAVEEIALQARSWGTTRIGAPAFQALLPANAPVVTVAVLDSGVDVAHPFLAGRISATRWNFIADNNHPNDVDGHGTHVAGIVVDASSPNVRIMPLKVMNDEGRGVDSVIIEALRFAADQGAAIANMSIGGPAVGSHSWGEIIAYARSRGMTLVASAGNDGTTAMNYPAAFPGVIAVSASTSTDALASFSNRGDWVDIGAPGHNISSSIPGGRYATASGTSMAAPHVSAAVALLQSYTAMAQEEILPYLISLAAPWPAGFTGGGAGIINLTPRGPRLPGRLSLREGETVLLAAAQSPPVRDASFTFTSSNISVAAVSPNGGVVGLRPGNATITASRPGLTLTVPVTVSTVESIRLINAAPMGHWIDRPLSLRENVGIYYSDGSYEWKTLGSEYMSGFVQGQRGWQMITITYKGASLQFPIWVDTLCLRSVGVRGPNKLSYMPGEELDLTGANLILSWSGAEFWIDAGSETIPITADMITGYDQDSHTHQTVYALWEGRRISSFTVYKDHPEFARRSEILTRPTQMAIPPLQPVDPTGGTIRIHYANSATQAPYHRDFELRTAIWQDSLQWDYRSFLNAGGEFFVNTLVYGLPEQNGYFLKTPNPAAGIRLVRLPNKLSYQLGEPIDPTGGVVRFTAHDGSTFDYPLQAKWCSWGTVPSNGRRTINVTVRNYDSGDTTNDSRKWEITTSYEVNNPSAIVPNPVTFTTLTLLSPPTRRDYFAGDRLNTAGGRLRLHFSDGSATDIDLRPEHITGFNPTRMGTQTLTVNLSGRTATFTVTVRERAESIEIVRLPNQLAYQWREPVNLAGGTVRVNNPDGSSEIIPMTSARIHFNQVNGRGNNATGFDLVQIICDGIAITDFIVVYVNAAGFLDGISGSDTLIYKQDYFVLPRVEVPYVRWESSNSGVITLNADGTINFVGRGSTAISLIYDPPGGARHTIGRIDVNVEFTIWQWLLFIFAFGWLWM